MYINISLKKAAALIIFSLFSFTTYSQDAVFSQYYASALYLNPALAGIEQNLSLSTNARTQWSSFGIPAYNTMQASFIKPFYRNGVEEKHLGGAGLSVYNNTAGDGSLRTLGINLNGAYNVQLSKVNAQYLTLGVQMGVVQKQINFADLKWGSQYDVYNGYNSSLAPDPSVGSAQKMYPDISAGLMYYYNASKDYTSKKVSFYLGAAAYHLNSPDESLIAGGSSKLPMLMKFHGGLEWNMSSRINISPNAIMLMQNGFTQINTGMYLTFLFGEGTSPIVPAYFILGGWYRLEDSFIASTGIGNNYYVLGFSFDVNNSQLRYNSIGSKAYEISLKIQKPRANKIKRFYTPRI